MKKRTKSQSKIAKVMREYKAGELHSGGREGPIVKSERQARAIAMSEAGVKKKSGGKKKRKPAAKKKR